MKIKELIIHNIASIADARVDFNGPELCNEPLFLICGETGSGKTTLLDAICLALYNDTPRLRQATRDSYEDVNGDSITLTNPAQYLRKGTGEGFINLSFEAGGKEYIAKWSIARAYKRADGKYQKCNWSVEDVSTHIEMKGADIEGIIGMGFEEFRRTVMLAQGEFTAFLKSKNEEKTKILEKITGTGIYKRIGQRICEHFHEAQTNYNIKNQSIALTRTRLLSDEQTNALVTEIEVKTKEIAEKENTRLNLDKLKVAKVQEDEALAEISNYDKVLKESEAEFSNLSGGLQFALNAQKAKELEYQQINIFIEQNSSKDSVYQDSKLIIQTLSDVTSNEKSILLQKNESKVVEEDCKKIETELKSKDSELVKLKEQYTTIKKDIEELSAKKKALDVEKLKSAKTVLEKITQMENDCKKLSEQIKNAENEAAKLDVKVTESDKSYNKASEIYSVTKATFDKLKLANSDWAKEARTSLHVGDECPICGHKLSQADLEMISDAHFESIIAPIQKQLKDAEIAKEQCFKDFSTISAEHKSIYNQIINLKKEQDNNNQKLDKFIHQKPDDITLDIVNERLELAEKLTSAIEEQNTRLQKLNQLVTKCTEVRGSICSKLESTKTKISSIKRYIEDTTKKNEEILAQNDLRMGDTQWRSEWSNNRVAFCEKLKTESDNYLNALENKRRLENTLKIFKDTIDPITDIKNEIIKNNATYAKIPVGECKVIKEQTQAWTSLNARISTASSGKITAEEKLKRLDRIAAEALKNLANYFGSLGIELCDVDKSKADSHLNALSIELTKLSEEIGSKKNQLMRNQTDKELIAKEINELKKLTELRDKWKSLNDVFGKKDGEYFQRIAQGFVMNDILSRANHYLKTITKRYLLESQPGSLEILVKDLEQGGVTRSTSTISGGESFIISLALALGLSSLGAGGNIYVDTLFIDEGFGTLSGEYLDTVTETLQKLSENGGKRVGIISHVKELRERIGAKIIVAKINPTESRVCVTSN